MIMPRSFIFFMTLCISVVTSVAAYDNRYFFWLRDPIERMQQGSFYADIKGFVLRSTNAWNTVSQDAGLFELNGIYDLGQIGKSLEAIGKTNPLPTEWRGAKIIFHTGGKLEGAGVRWALEQDLWPYTSIGMYGQVLKARTRMGFIFDQQDSDITISNANEQAQLEQALLKANQELGLSPVLWSAATVGDFDFYLRLGNHWQYPSKFKAITAGARIGFLAPFGKKQELYNPASLPVAGNGFFGAYISGDAEFELKDDVKVGLQLFFIQRFSQTRMFRVPLDNEPNNFGVIVDRFKVSPRMTFVAAPYVLFDDIRDGLGAGVGYTYISHNNGDQWINLDPQADLEPRLDKVRRRSAWSAEYLSVRIRYDFTRALTIRRFMPCIEFVWDAPIEVLGAHSVSKTNRISLGIVFEL